MASITQLVGTIAPPAAWVGCGEELRSCEYGIIPGKFIGGKHVMYINTMRPEQNGWYFEVYILKCILLYGNYPVLFCI